MLAYPITIGDFAGIMWRATFPDFPYIMVLAVDQEDIIPRAVYALEDVISTRIHDRKDIPFPSQGDTYVMLPTLTSVKVMLYQEMREQGVGKAELARRTGWYLPQVDRALDVQHRSRFDMMDVALRAVGKKLVVTVTDTSDPVIESTGQEKEAIGAM